MDENKCQVVTMTFFRFDTFANMRWAFSQVVRARAPLNKTEGLEFYKLFGLGGGHGYSLKNKFDKYGFLGVWENREQAETFFEGPLFSEFKRRSIERYMIYMVPLSSRGSWSGFNRWQPPTHHTRHSDLVCVLTRATLRPRYIFRFFSQIAKVVRDHVDRDGLILTQGFSELPLIEQATFSIWENETLMKNFAYQNAHAEVIRMTREHGGFREEMYTRMEPIATKGTWMGTDPLDLYLKQTERIAS